MLKRLGFGRRAPSDAREAGGGPLRLGTLALRLPGWLLTAALLAHVLTHWSWPWLESLDRSWADLRARIMLPEGPVQGVAIVEIDARALDSVGDLPWTASQWGELIDRIGRVHGARLVIADPLLAQLRTAESADAVETLLRGPLRDQPEWGPRLRALQAQHVDDGALRMALQGTPTVLAWARQRDPSALDPSRARPTLPDTALGARAWRVERSGPLAPPPSGVAGLATFGQAELRIETDGTARRLALLRRSGDGLVASVDLLAALRALGSPVWPQTQPEPTAPGWWPLQRLTFGGAPGAGPRLSIATDAQARIWLPLRSQESFQRHSADDILRADALPRGALQGKIVLIGVTAGGAQRVPTALSAETPEVDLHAAAVEALLLGRTKAEPAWASPVQALLLLASLLAMQRVLARSGLGLGTLLALLLMALILLGNLALAAATPWAMPLAAPLVLPPLLVALHLVASYHRTALARHQLADRFGQYVPPELADALGRRSDRDPQLSRSAELTVMFADMRGFSRLAQQLPPGELTSTMNLLLGHLTDIVREHGGTLDKYIGDSVMAFWGAPVDDPDHALHAVEAGLAMMQRLPALRAEMAARGWPDVDLSIGINTGRMVVGELGSRHRRAYTVLGDAVNIAARLQSLAARDDAGLVIGDATRRALGTRLVLPLGAWSTRGRDRSEPAWAPLPWHAGENAVADRFVARWIKMRMAFESRSWGEAQQQLDMLRQVDPQHKLVRWQQAQLDAAQDLGRLRRVA